MQLRRRDEFFATLLHELRNPLAPIATALDLLGRKTDEQTVGAMRGIIQRQLCLLTRLVDDLVDVSRIERGDIEMRLGAVDLAEVVAGALEIAQPLLEVRKHGCAVSVPRSRFMVRADAIRLTQVVTNLVINAVKYTNPGGCISLVAEERADRICLRVRDNGIGIAHEQLARVFELFVQGSPTARAQGGGRGIGLAVARQLIELQGGTICAHSEGPGRGSEFTICLPGWHDSRP